MEKRYLVLETGEVFEGVACGAEADTVGELVFTTGVVGYVEALTDPCYYGQILMFTFPQLGNYGVMADDQDGRSCSVKGIVMREHCSIPSNFRCEGTLDDFLKKQGIPGICGVDTRALTQIVRDHGVMNAVITSAIPDGIPGSVKTYKITDSVPAVSADRKFVVPSDGETKYSVSMIDYGSKKNIISELTSRGCRVTVFPFNATAGEILASNPDGIMLSNGPGDPSDNVQCIGTVKELLGKKPIFAVGLGHQIMALAAGARTEKLKYGHRGSNQPVREKSTGRIFITGQNHGYVVNTDSLAGTGAECSYENANDGTCEGIVYPGKNAFSLQFHPETHSGPRELEYAFDRFISLMGGNK